MQHDSSMYKPLERALSGRDLDDNTETRVRTTWNERQSKDDPGRLVEVKDCFGGSNERQSGVDLTLLKVLFGLHIKLWKEINLAAWLEKKKELGNRLFTLPKEFNAHPKVSYTYICIKLREERRKLIPVTISE